jgi:hypothetical protein
MVLIKPNYPFQVVLEHRKMPDGGPQRATARTLLAVLSHLKEYFKNNQWTSEIESSSVYQPVTVRKAA